MVGPKKRNDLPQWEVVAHAAGGAGALVDKYYDDREGAGARTHGQQSTTTMPWNASPDIRDETFRFPAANLAAAE